MVSAPFLSHPLFLILSQIKTPYIERYLKNTSDAEVSCLLLKLCLPRFTLVQAYTQMCQFFEWVLINGYPNFTRLLIKFDD